MSNPANGYYHQQEVDRAAHRIVTAIKADKERIEQDIALNGKAFIIVDGQKWKVLSTEDSIQSTIKKAERMFDFNE